MICPDCKGKMFKAAIQNEFGLWILWHGCDCELDTTKPIEEAGDEQGVECYYHHSGFFNPKEI